MGIAETFRSFITTNFYVADPAALADDDSLLDAGIIDSTGVLDLIGFIEQQFGFTVADEDLVPENLDTITRLTTFVSLKNPGAQGVSAE